MDTCFIITFISDDRPGLVEDLSSAISEQGGNWLESRLSQLAGKFAGLIRVSLPASQGDALELALKNLSEKGLSVRVTAAEHTLTVGGDLHKIKLAILGPDRPGIVREIATALAAHNLNVVELESDVSSAPMSAEPLFNARIEADIAAESDLDELRETLDEIANQMLVDISFEQGQ